MQGQILSAMISITAILGMAITVSAEEAPLYEASLLFDTEALRLPDGRVSHHHSPSLVETPGGDLIACWFHGRGEREDNTMVVIGARRNRRAAAWFYLSDDEGRTWNWRQALERFEPGQGSGQYPTLIQSADGSIHIVYTHQDAAKFDGRTIKHVRFNEAWVMTGDGGVSPADR